MKRTIVISLLLISLSLNVQAFNFDAGLKTRPTKETVLSLITEIVRLFNEHADSMGGAGFFYGVKSKLISLVSDSHREAFQLYILWTPLYMLAESGISDDDPNIGKIFVGYCEMLPSAYDSYQSCRNKAFLCVRTIYPDRDDRFYRRIVESISRETGAKWLTP